MAGTSQPRVDAPVVVNGCAREMAAVVDAIPAGVLVIDPAWEIWYVNAEAARLCGMACEEMLGKNCWDLPPAVREASLFHQLLKAADEGAAVDADHFDAERKQWVRIRARHCADGSTAMFMKEAGASSKFETELRQSDDRFYSVVETTPECVMLIAPDGAVLHVNGPGLAMLGASSPDALAGRPVFDLIAPEYQSDFRRLNEMVCEGQRGVLELEMVGPNGGRAPVEAHSAPVRDSKGRVVHLMITRDISYKKHADRSARLLSAIVDSSSDAIISKDLTGHITSWNMGAQRLFGYSADEVVGQPGAILIPAERADEEHRILARLQCGERVEHFETVRRSKDGKLIDLSLTISPIKDDHGQVIGSSKIARDITARKRVELELRRANQDLEQFAFSASHDLQEPLRTIKIYSELLSQRHADRLEGQALQFLQFLGEAASRMEVLVRDLLAYTHVGDIEPPSEETDANEALAATLADLGGAIAESGAQVEAERLPPLRMHNAHLKQLFQNIISNAIKYRSLDRPPAIRICAERQDSCWVIAISDNGIGIEPKFREQIFGLFNRLHNDEKYSGTGIGLALCQRVVERYHGRLWAESTPGEGSTFRFTIPFT